MRVISKIFSILFVLSVLYVLSPPPIYAAACSGPGYTCRKFDCAVGEVEDTSRTCTLYDYICCKRVPTSTPRPTSTPQPTSGGDFSVASPTVTKAPTPTTGGALCPNPTYPNCNGSDYCTVVNCGKTIPNCGTPTISPISNCSSFCFQSHCYTTNISPNPTITNIPCPSNAWGPWYCASCSNCIDNLCEYRFCAAPGSNQYQIRCGNFGCQPYPTSGDGGGSGSLQSHVSTQNKPSTNF